jgi:TRAP-type transport system periplasmic protein
MKWFRAAIDDTSIEQHPTRRANMKNHVRGSALVFLTVSLAFVWCVSPTFAQTKPISITFSTIFPPTHKMGVLTGEWGKEIEKKTNGRVTVRVHYGATLMGIDKFYDGVVNGIADAAAFAPSSNPGKFPLSEVFDLPLGYKSSRQATRLFSEYLDKFKPKEFDQVKILNAFTNSPLVLHSNRPVVKLEDLKGLKARSTGTTAKVFAALGGTPVSLPMPETYDSLARGVIDSVVSTIEALQGFKIAEVTKFTTSGTHMNFILTQMYIMNKEKWESLPKDIQGIVEAVSKEYGQKSSDAFDELDVSAKDYATKMGHKFVVLSSEEDAKFAKIVTPLFDGYVRETKQRGLPADEVMKFCLERIKQIQ